MKLIRCAKAGYIVSAVAFIALGLILTIWPEMSMITISYAAGAIVLASGIVRIAGYFSKDLYSLAFQFDLALGIFTVLIGIVFLLHPQWLISAIPFFVGIFVLVNGLFTFQTSLDSKRFGMKYWWVMLIFSVLSSALGIVLIIDPFTGAGVLTILIGVTMMCTGIEKLFLALYTIVIKKKNKHGSDYIETDCRNIDED